MISKEALNKDILELPVLGWPLIKQLKKVHLEPPKDYNFKEGDILLCHSKFYTFKSSSDGDLEVYDRHGYITFLKADEINGSINVDDYPELLL